MDFVMIRCAWPGGSCRISSIGERQFPGYGETGGCEQWLLLHAVLLSRDCLVIYMKEEASLLKGLCRAPGLPLPHKIQNLKNSLLLV